MIREGIIFKIALAISVTIHIGGFCLLRGNSYPFLQNGFGNVKESIVVFEIGEVEIKRIETCPVNPDPDITGVKDKEGEMKQSLETKPIHAMSSQAGSSGCAKEDIGGVNDEYLLSVRRCIERVKFYPKEARRRLINGSVTVSFYIDGNGSPNSVCIIKSSGFSILDNTAEEIIRRASPFPKPAGSRLNQYIQTTIVFRYE